jgi:hypothetical protein
MRSRFLIEGLLLLFLLGCQRSGKSTTASARPEQAAAFAIGVLQRLVTEQNFRSLGFDSPEQVKRAQPGQPLAVFDVGLDQLKAYKPGVDPDHVLQQSARIIYPVTVDGQVKSSITITHKESRYQASNFGDAEIIKRLSRYRLNQPEGSDFIVRVPAFNMYFLGRRVEGRLVLVPIIDDPRLKLTPGEAVGADIVLEQLVPLANSYNGLPM